MVQDCVEDDLLVLTAVLGLGYVKPAGFEKLVRGAPATAEAPVMALLLASPDPRADLLVRGLEYGIFQD